MIRKLPAELSLTKAGLVKIHDLLDAALQAGTIQAQEWIQT